MSKNETRSETRQSFEGLDDPEAKYKLVETWLRESNVITVQETGDVVSQEDCLPAVTLILHNILTDKDGQQILASTLKNHPDLEKLFSEAVIHIGYKHPQGENEILKLIKKLARKA